MITWNEEQRDLRALAEELGEAAGKDHLERDAHREFGTAAWQTVRETGLLGLPFDERWGGLGQDLLTTMYVLEGLGYACRDGGFSFSVSTHLVSTGVPLQRFGSIDLKERYLTRVCDGSIIGAHAISEPSGGSDVMAMRTTAVRDGADYVLNGSKAFVTNGPIADVIVVYALTGKRGSPAALTAFLVERNTPGLVVGPPVTKMGLSTSPFCELFLDDCRVPAANVVGSLGAGYLVMDHVMKWEILCSFIINVGEMQHRLERSIDYARTREQFGQKIGSFQSVSNRIADMHISVNNARKWLYDTGQRLGNGENVTVDIAASKLIASEGNLASALSAVQIFGGYGYTTEYGLEKDLRDAVAGTIYSGTSDIQRQRIAKMLGL
ncbi:acyl-CoA dehydrogenase family protein [Catellatospora citrea]|uniref:Acyl-CoA dehydrogenase n=1 Tax=Catellatospora citrea TaxID=53366 RepID=A0A8J3KBK9_9ACTN|nr:acyl-CoA dehydrogenase family protein [Catellatospora citrea]RKE11157.1 L-prolyl-[peptidyl carrier protein] dehydrogenase [Catellatospora citrea]GIF96622.1 acyl-CoA dehydrogenase [Catellatospora citrea]